jgi:hypothetical protein
LEAPLKFLPNYLLEMVGHILLDVLDGIKSFSFAFIYNFGKRKKCHPEPNLVNGGEGKVVLGNAFCERNL